MVLRAGLCLARLVGLQVDLYLGAHLLVDRRRVDHGLEELREEEGLEVELYNKLGGKKYVSNYANMCCNKGYIRKCKIEYK